MNIRAFVYLAITTGILVFLLFIVSFSSRPSLSLKKERLNHNYVRGSAIEHDEVLYTLNFEQQKAMIHAINDAEMASLPLLSSHNPPFTKLVIYRFNSPDIEITPIAYLNDNLVFSSPEWEESKPLMENSQGQLKQILENSYDS